MRTLENSPLLASVYKRFSAEQQNKFKQIKQQNPNRGDEEIIFEILDSAKREKKEKERQKRLNEMMRHMKPATTRIVTKWQEILKKKNKPFHGYNPNRHSKKGGLNAKGRAKFKRETGANLKAPVTTKPSKLKAGSKAAKRRKSFCARMCGSKGPTSKKGKLTPKGASLKVWNCNC